MNYYKLCVTVLAFGLAYWMGAAESSEKSEREMEYEINATLTEGELLERGATEPEVAVEALFEEDAKKKWKRFTEDFSLEQIRDFFCGAVILRGPVNQNSSLAGIYNVWWDAMLITESYEKTVDAGGESGKVRKVGDFAFVSGAVFRGENGTETDVAKKLASPGGSPSKIVLDLMSRTQKQFDALYGKRKTTILLDHSKNQDLSKKQIVACAGLRLKMTQLLLNDKVRYDDAWSMAKILRTGTRDTFDLVFPSEFGRMMSRTFCRLPKNIRADFEPYGFYPDKNGGKARIYVFINTKFPRLFAVASLGLGDESTLEWYDFYRSEELVKVFDMAEKEAGK